ERRITATLAALAALADDAGLGGEAARLHGFPPLDPVVFDLAAAERVVDVAATHVLFGRDTPHRIRRAARTLAGCSRLPLCAPLAPLGEWLQLAAGAGRDDSFGFAAPLQHAFPRARDALVAALAALRLPFVIVDESVPDERLRALPAIVALTFDFLDTDLAAR